MNGICEVTFQPYGKRLSVESGLTILDVARRIGVDITSLCAGKGTCGKCKVKVEFGSENVEPITQKEMKHLSREEVNEGYRIACLTRILGKMIISVPERSRVGKQRLQTEGLEIPIVLDPSTKKYFIDVPRATLNDPRSDEERLLQSLIDRYGLRDLTIDYEAARQLPVSLRKENGRVTVVVWNDQRIMAIEPGDTSQRCYGFAVDIGSTKLAGFLIDLNNGKVMATAARMNPQIPYGEDIISRINYSMAGQDKLEELQEAVIDGINDLINQCCESAKIRPEEIYDSSFVGNTCMHHLFLGLTPKHVALSPYVPAIKRGVQIQAAKLSSLNTYKYGRVYVAPVIGGFVGGDSVADIMVADMLTSGETILDIDIGTNTEIALGNKEKVTICSCASGPAFEGMHIKHGMRAATGAIERISIDPETHELSFRTIDDALPVGICGSGLIDLLAELLKAGIMDCKGKLLDKQIPPQLLRRGTDGIAFVIVPQKTSGIDTDIVVTESDIRELQLAKAAIHTGASIMMIRMGLSLNDISKLIIAGAFGNYIDPESARTIGMYPEVALDKISFVGNSAGTGSRMMLTSKECKIYADRIAEEVHYLELAIQPEFIEEYAKSMFFPYMDLDKYPITKELLTRLNRSRDSLEGVGFVS
jgi:uncharacterized 2Fe-2S/4Fe-4S cluster protein (DUF4445 family)